jgi:hypothetical protein
MELVKLKENVNFNVLLEYGFIYNGSTKRYERETKWTLENACHQLVVEENSREVYMEIMKTKNKYKLFNGTFAKLYNTTLVKLLPYLEIVEDFGSIEGVPHVKGE